MSFESQTAALIWEDLYTALVPDFMTLNKDYIRTFGVPSSGNRDVDRMMATNNSYVKIPIIKILEYYDNGVIVQIPSRADMITIHKSIEKYLGEWREHIRYDINLDRGEHKTLLTSLDKLSKLIFDKADAKEVIDNILKPKYFGLPKITARPADVKSDLVKPDYEGIGNLLKGVKKRGRF